MRLKDDGTQYYPMDHVRDILVHEMGISEDRITIAGEDFKIPPDEDLFIVIEPKGAPKVIANRNIVEPTVSAFTEKQEVNTQEMIAVMLFSRSLEAYNRSNEVLMAIQSLYAQGVQEANSFKIARMSNIENLSDLEGGAMLRRYELTLVIFVWYEKTKAGEYFDKLSLQLDTEKESVEISLT